MITPIDQDAILSPITKALRLAAARGRTRREARERAGQRSADTDRADGQQADDRADGQQADDRDQAAGADRGVN